MLDTYIKFLKAHETILLCALAAALVWGVTGKVESAIGKHDATTLSIAQAQSVAAAAKVSTDETLVAQQKVANDVLTAKLTAQNSALAQANIALVTALTKQQKVDDTLTEPELVQRWDVLVP